MMDEKLYLGTGTSSAKDYEGLYSMLDAALQNGIRNFDTAPSYKTEDILGKTLTVLTDKYGLNRGDYKIQTKIDPWQMQDGNIRKFVQDAMKKLGVDYLDSLLVHWFEPDYFEDTWIEFCKLYEEGIVNRIGVCNVRERHIKRLLNSNFPPQIVQVERNPLRICKEEVALCKENEIEIQAYSSLCKMDSRIKDSAEVNRIAEAHNKSVGQIVLRWHLDTGVIPIFTSTKPQRIKEYTDIFDFKLSKREIDIIDSLNENYKMFLESCICPGF